MKCLLYSYFIVLILGICSNGMVVPEKEKYMMDTQDPDTIYNRVDITEAVINDKDGSKVQAKDKTLEETIKTSVIPSMEEILHIMSEAMGEDLEEGPVASPRGEQERPQGGGSEDREDAGVEQTDAAGDSLARASEEDEDMSGEGEEVATSNVPLVQESLRDDPPPELIVSEAGDRRTPANSRRFFRRGRRLPSPSGADILDDMDNSAVGVNSEDQLEDEEELAADGRTGRRGGRRRGARRMGQRNQRRVNILNVMEWADDNIEDICMQLDMDGELKDGQQSEDDDMDTAKKAEHLMDEKDIDMEERDIDNDVLDGAGAADVEDHIGALVDEDEDEENMRDEVSKSRENAMKLRRDVQACCLSGSNQTTCLSTLRTRVLTRRVCGGGGRRRLVEPEAAAVRDACCMQEDTTDCVELAYSMMHTPLRRNKPAPEAHADRVCEELAAGTFRSPPVQLAATDPRRPLWESVYSTRRMRRTGCCVFTGGSRVACMAEVEQHRVDSVCNGTEALIPPWRPQPRDPASLMLTCCGVTGDERITCFNEETKTMPLRIPERTGLKPAQPRGPTMVHVMEALSELRNEVNQRLARLEDSLVRRVTDVISRMTANNGERKQEPVEEDVETMMS